VSAVPGYHQSSVMPTLELDSHGSPRKCRRLWLRHEAAAEWTPPPVSPRCRAVGGSAARSIGLHRWMTLSDGDSHLRGAEENDPPGVMAVRSAGRGPGGRSCNVPRPSLRAEALLGKRPEQRQMQRT